MCLSQWFIYKYGIQQIRVKAKERERESKRVVFEFHKEFSQHVRMWKKKVCKYKVPILLV